MTFFQASETKLAKLSAIKLNSHSILLSSAHQNMIGMFLNYNYNIICLFYWIPESYRLKIDCKIDLHFI